MHKKYLFIDGDLRENLEKGINRLGYELKEVPKEMILENSEALAQRLEEKLIVNVPILEQPKIGDEKRISKGQIDYGRKINVPGLRINIEIPFKGNEDVFKYSPSTQYYAKPFGAIYPNKLVFSVFAADGNEGQAKQEIKEQIELINNHLDNSKKDIERYNAEVPRKIRELIKKQKDEIEKDERTIEDIGSFLKGNT